jgi:hypothetical protein
MNPAPGRVKRAATWQSLPSLPPENRLSPASPLWTADRNGFNHTQRQPGYHGPADSYWIQVSISKDEMITIAGSLTPISDELMQQIPEPREGLEMKKKDASDLLAMYLVLFLTFIAGSSHSLPVQPYKARKTDFLLRNYPGFSLHP